MLVDVGTGFFVDKDRAQAKKFYEAKVEELEGNLNDLASIIKSKSESLSFIEDGMWSPTTE